MANRILIFLPNLELGGAERGALIRAREFTRLGYEVSFALAEAKGALLSEAEADFEVVDLGATRLRNSFQPLRHLLKTRRYDVLLAHMWPMTFIAALAAFGLPARAHGVEDSVLSHQFRDQGAIKRFGLRVGLAVMTRLIPVASVSKGAAIALGELAFNGPVQTLYNSVDATSDAGIEKTETLWGAPKGPRLLSVGNLKKVKNHALLLDAFSMLSDQKARLMLVGYGDEQANLKAQVKTLGIAPRVIFAGFQPDPMPFYKTADAFVLSSNSESFGNVIVEAMAHGCQIISTDCDYGPREILNGGALGRLVPCGDASALAGGIERALSAPIRAKELAKRAAEFAPQETAKHYLSFMGFREWVETDTRAR